MELFNIQVGLEENEDIHLARILILLDVFTNGQNQHIKGFTKLAKLDFLLRYPTYLEKALESKKANSKKLTVKDYERKSVESSMVRYKYGPWDFRYRKFINVLYAKGLVQFTMSGKSIIITITPLGKEIAKSLSDTDDFKDINGRSKILKKYFNISGTNLMKFIYQTFPEIGSLDYGTTIK